MRRIAASRLVLAGFLISLVAFACDDEDTVDVICTAGDKGCPCKANGTCDAGFTCDPATDKCFEPDGAGGSAGESGSDGKGISGGTAGSSASGGRAGRGGSSAGTVPVVAGSTGAGRGGTNSEGARGGAAGEGGGGGQAGLSGGEGGAAGESLGGAAAGGEGGSGGEGGAEPIGSSGGAGTGAEGGSGGEAGAAGAGGNECAALVIGEFEPRNLDWPSVNAQNARFSIQGSASNAFDRVVVEFRLTSGGDANGDITLGPGAQAGYDTCSHCVFARSFDGRYYFATSGTLSLDSSSDQLHGYPRGQLVGVTLEEATIHPSTYATTVLPDGDCLIIEGASVEVVPTDGWTECAPDLRGNGNCDCGCGAVDSDCTDETSASCESCWCSDLTCPGNVLSDNNAQCG